MVRFVNNYLFALLILLFVFTASSSSAQIMKFNESAIPQTGIPQKGDRTFFSANDSQNAPLIIRKELKKPIKQQKNKSWILRPSKEDLTIKINHHDTLKVVLTKHMNSFWKPIQKHRTAKLVETLIQNNDMIFVFNFTKPNSSGQLFFYNIDGNKVENVKKISVNVK